MRSAARQIRQLTPTSLLELTELQASPFAVAIDGAEGYSDAISMSRHQSNMAKLASLRQTEAGGKEQDADVFVTEGNGYQSLQKQHEASDSLLRAARPCPRQWSALFSPPLSPQEKRTGRSPCMSPLSAHSHRALLSARSTSRQPHVCRDQTPDAADCPQADWKNVT